MKTWEEFEEKLAFALVSVVDRVYLIIGSATDAKRYVQFAAAGTRLDAEASSRAEGADEAALTGSNWTPPSEPRGNWQSPLPLPALAAEYRELAVRCVVALRDAFGIAGPDALEYSAWREAEDPPSAPGAVRDTGESTLRLPGLGLRMRS